MRAFKVFVAAAILPCVAVAQPSPPLKPMTTEQWRADLKYFAKELPQRHKNAFHTSSRAQFDSAVAALDVAMPKLQSHEVVVRLMSITSMVGDGHTGIHWWSPFSMYPIAVFWFGDELRITATTAAAREALGARIVEIDGTPTSEVFRRVKGIMARAENEWHALGTSQALLVRPEILHSLGVAKGLGAARFTLENSGRRFDVTLTPVIANGPTPLALTSAAATPLFARKNPASAFWFEMLPDSQTLYVNFRRYDDLGDNAKKLFEFIDAHRVTRLVIDLRQNGGGDFFKGRDHLINQIKRRPALNVKDHLFVIIGRHTFSAAMVNAIDFRKETNATLVGEPIGEVPNSYSENDEFTLPNSRLIFSYSTKYYKFLDQDAPTVVPDQRIDPAWADFAAGRDAVLDWIVRRR